MAGGVSKDLLIKEKYQKDFRKILVNAGYFMTAVVHAMHYTLGKAIRSQSSFLSKLSLKLANILYRQVLLCLYYSDPDTPV